MALGIKDFINPVDFAASDAAMKDDEIATVNAGVQLLPMTAGKIVAYNLPEVKALLSREAYRKSFWARLPNGTIHSLPRQIRVSICPIWVSPSYAVPTAVARRSRSAADADERRRGKAGLAWGRP